MEVDSVDARLADKENSAPLTDHSSENVSKSCNKSGNVLKSSGGFEKQIPSEQNQSTEASTSEPSKKKRKKKKKKKKKTKTDGDSSVPVPEEKSIPTEAIAEEKAEDDTLSAKVALEEEIMESPVSEVKGSKIDSSLEVEAEDGEVAEIEDLSSPSEMEEVKEKKENAEHSPSVPRSPESNAAAEEEMVSEPEHVLEEDYVTVDEDAPSPLAMAGKEDGEIDDEDDAHVEEEEMGPFVEPSAEVIGRIVKQMEFYFSDANILKDYFLLRRIRKNKGGWLRVKLLAGFKLMKAITEDWRQIVFAIREKSGMLEVDEEGIRVRRKGGLPEWDHHVYKRTCLVYGFDRLAPRKKGNPEPSQVSVAFVRDKLFGRFGDRVKLVRILKPGKEIPLDLKTCVRNHSELGQYLCAVVEFDTVETAEAARRLVDSREWSRTHRLSVKILGKRLREPVEEEGYMFYPQAPYPYFTQVHPLMICPPRHYYWPQPSNSYADKVAGRKRPAPDSYADRARSCPKAEEQEAAAAAAPAPPTKREKRKPVPRTPQRQRAKSKSEAKAAEKGKENKGKTAPKPKPAENAKEKRGKSSTRRDEGTQTGLVLIRQPQGPPKEGTGIFWSRARALEQEVKQEAEKVQEMDQEAEKVQEVEQEAEKLQEMEENTDREVLDVSEEGEEVNGQRTGSEKSEEEAIGSEKEGRRKRGVQRRRSVKELVRKFEALSTDSGSPQEAHVVRRSGSVRLNEAPLVERKEN